MPAGVTLKQRSALLPREVIFLVAPTLSFRDLAARALKAATYATSAVPLKSMVLRSAGSLEAAPRDTQRFSRRGGDGAPVISCQLLANMGDMCSEDAGALRML